MTAAKDQLDEQQIAEYRETFKLFDKNGDGTIGANELRQVMESLGQKVSSDEINAMISDLDADNSGSIDFDEFLSILTKMGDNKENQENDLIEAFQVFDKDNNGYITREELCKVMESLGQLLSKAELDEMIREADTNGDGQIEYKEFAKMMESK